MVETQYVPDAMNQFFRLTRVSGPKGTGYYVPGSNWDNMHINPATGRLEDYDNRNCTATEAAVMVDAESLGHKHTTPVQIRNHQSDFRGGIGWDDVNEAYRDIFGPGSIMWTPGDFDWGDVIEALRHKRPVGIAVDYDAVPYQYQEQKGGTFDHAMSLHGFRSSDSRILRHDPLGRGMEWVPQNAVRPAAEKIALAQRGTRSRLFVMVAQPAVIGTTLPSTGYRVAVHPEPPATSRRYWRYILQGDYIVDREGHSTRGFSARCTPPVDRKVLSTKRDEFPKAMYHLVKVVDPGSAYNGWFIDAGYSMEV